jgi:hypothetical protein
MPRDFSRCNAEAAKSTRQNHASRCTSRWRVLGVASIMQNFFGHPDCSKIATTQIVNQAEVFLRQNLAAWKALPADQKTPATMFF